VYERARLSDEKREPQSGGSQHELGHNILC
jgi:hypothetical protein